MRKSAQLLLGFFSVFILSFIIYPLYFSQSYADISSCTYSSTPDTMDGNDTVFTFTITNNDSGNTSNWVQIARSTNDFSLSQGSATGWNASGGNDLYRFFNGSLSPSTSSNFSITASSNSGDIVTANWTVTISDDGNGSTQTNCTIAVAPTPTSTPGPTPTPTPVTIVVTGTPAPTPTSTPGPTPTPTTITDKTPPTLTVTTDFSGVYKDSPAITGNTSDKSGVGAIDVSLDNGQNWLSVSGFTKGALTTTYSFTPSNLDDGNYLVIVRATDTKGNASLSRVETLIIDRLPPIIGSVLTSIGPQVLLGQDSVAGIDQKMTLSSRGGATDIILSAYINASDSAQKVSFKKSLNTGLWSGVLNFKKPGLYKMSIFAIDGAKNTTTKDLESILVKTPGKIKSASGGIIKDARITVYYQDPYSYDWVVWDAEAFGEENPQKVSSNGAYSFYLPVGKYYLKVEAGGFHTTISNIFSYAKPAPLAENISLKESNGFHLGPITIPFFDFTQDSIRIPGVDLEQGVSTNVPLVGHPAPLFILPTTSGNTFDMLANRGNSSIVTFISTWSPLAIEQLSFLDKVSQRNDMKTVVIAEQEKLPALTVFSKRGEYKFPFIVDSDGILVDMYKIQDIPTHYFLDNKGIVREREVGVLSDQEIIDIMAKMSNY